MKRIAAHGTEHAKVTVTKREGQILSLVSYGEPDKEIAFVLGITLRTVQTYIAGLMHGLGFDNRTKMARWAWFNPEVYSGEEASMDLHLRGCRCPHPQCVAQLAIHLAHRT